MNQRRSYTRMKEGDRLVSRDGVELTVTYYRNATWVEVSDQYGNKRISSVSHLHKGLMWYNPSGTLRKQPLHKRSGRNVLRGRRPRRYFQDILDYYVYLVWLKGEIIYIGSGKKDRILHCFSGRSDNRELNRLYFENSPIIAEVYMRGLSKKEAENLEKGLIRNYRPVCNSRFYDSNDKRNSYYDILKQDKDSRN